MMRSSRSRADGASVDVFHDATQVRFDAIFLNRRLPDMSSTSDFSPVFDSALGRVSLHAHIAS